MNPIRAWLSAFRPKTLPLSVTPVAVGLAVAWSEQASLSPGPAIATLAAALLIQIGTNLHNDVKDYERGADTSERLGPPRATAEGWLSPRQVRAGAYGSFAAAFAIGIYLAWVGGWPIVILGLASLLAGLGYTGGPKPLAYTPLGELFVWLFFGLGAVAGTGYLQTGHVTPLALWAGAALGLHAAAVLTVNNFRDQDSDRRAGRRTLVVLIGTRASRAVYAASILVPFLLPPFLWLSGQHDWVVLLPLSALPGAATAVHRFTHAVPEPGLNVLLARTARLQALFGLLLAAGLVMG